ncbi:F-box protein CPR1-like [Daucus carota subsp. sativus]|uniref:F-box protein CPR1-like n=1 Tax=Daucus carota subsp. sativus TaxID=79200 RepID=UPI0030833C51
MKTQKFSLDGLLDDLLMEVLVRLPVKHLIGCKLVSKTWLSVISSPTFIKAHLHRSITAKGDDETLITHLFVPKEDEEDDGVDYYGPFGLVELGAEEVVADLKYPYSQGDEFSFQPQEAVLVASDCGIACVSIFVRTPHDEGYQFVFENKVYLWNPATKQSKLIPLHEHDGFRRCAFGFGVDTMDLDCKIVSVASHCTPFSTIVKSSVYSAKSNSWREIEVTDVPKKEKFDLCLHGFILCIGYKGLMAFNLEAEAFVCGVELPVIGDGKSTITDDLNDIQGVIIDFNDSIAVAISNYDQPSNTYFNLWTLVDEACLRADEIEASWTKMLSIDVGLPISSVLGYYNRRDFMLEDERGEWFLYKSDEENHRIAPIYMDPHQVFKYAESLIPIPGSKQVRWTNREEDN